MPTAEEEMREYKRLWYIANKEKIKESGILYRENNKEEIGARGRLYRENNKEKLKERKRLWRENNKEKDKEIHRLYNQTPVGIRSTHYGHWKFRGVIFDGDEDYWYDRYIESKKCEVCAKPYKSDSDRHLDHDHTITDAPNVRPVSYTHLTLPTIYSV